MGGVIGVECRAPKAGAQALHGLQIPSATTRTRRVCKSGEEPFGSTNLDADELCYS